MGCGTRWAYTAAKAHSTRIHSVSFSPDGQTLLSGKNIRLWDLATGTLTRTLQIDARHVLIVRSLSPDGRTVAMVGGTTSICGM